MVQIRLEVVYKKQIASNIKRTLPVELVYCFEYRNRSEIGCSSRTRPYTAVNERREIVARCRMQQPRRSPSGCDIPKIGLAYILQRTNLTNHLLLIYPVSLHMPFAPQSRKLERKSATYIQLYVFNCVLQGDVRK